MPKVLMSTLGRSHFVVAADAIVRQGGDLTLLQGWVPKDLDSVLVRMASKIIGRKSFVAGLSKRRTRALKDRIIEEPLGELVQTFLFLTFAKFGPRMFHACVKMAFAVHGFCTRRHLKGYSIFHVKSGLGRGGAIRRAKQLGLKVLVDHCTPHPGFMEKSAGVSRYTNNRSYWSSVMKDCYDADLVMVGSEFIKKTFVENGFPENKLRVNPLGVLPHFLNVKTEYRVKGTLELIYTGAWIYTKGCHDLTDAIAVLLNRGLDVHLTVAGSYSDNEESVARCRRENLPITFLGHIPQDDLRGCLSNAEIFVFPSLYDGFAVSAFEGMAAGLCLLTTHESSVPIEDGETGYYIPAHNGAAIADRIEYLYFHRELIESIGRRAARNVAENYTWENYAKRALSTYVELEAM